MISEQHQKPTLLVVEDSDEDFEALKRTINQVSNQKPISIIRCSDGDDAMDLLNRQGQYKDVDDRFTLPDLIVLDLNLPGTDGREVLAAIKHSETLKTIPVVVLSTSSNPKDIEACYKSGCNSYMIKPMNSGELRNSIQMMLCYWFEVVVLPAEVVLQRT
jgi:CheY-like chemotaxis protein